jgi:hypothetical protein
VTKPILDTYMPGKLLCFEKRGDDQTVDETVIVEVTDTSHGEIEFAFDDRNERVYLKVPIARVLANIPAKYKK